MTDFIAIASGKGGVGKTTIAINLGQALTCFGKETIVVDGNLLTPNVGLHLGIQRAPVTLHDVLEGKRHITDAIYLHSSGLKVIPANIAFDARKTNTDSFSDTILDLHGKADVVLIDAPAGLGSEVVSTIDASDFVLVVTTPKIPSVADSLKMIKLVKERGKRLEGAIVNANNEHSELSIENVEAILGCKVLGAIPEDKNVEESRKINYPVVFSHPESEASVSFKTIAAALFGETYKKSIKKESIFSRIFK